MKQKQEKRDNMDIPKHYQHSMDFLQIPLDILLRIQINRKDKHHYHIDIKMFFKMYYINISCFIIVFGSTLSIIRNRWSSQKLLDLNFYECNEKN